MKKILIIIACLVSTSVWSKSDVSSFHRLIVLNENDEILMIKIKDADFWVTPGLYQDQQSSVKEGLNILAANYGLTISSPKLRGMFSLAGGDNKIFSLRNMFVARVNSYQPKAPEIISDVRWLPIDKAMQLMTFPHINLMLEKMFKAPDKVWAGGIARYKENGEFKAKIVEPFYSL